MKPLSKVNSLNLILHNDIHRYNKLMRVIKAELTAVKKAILGLDLYDERVELTSHHILNNTIPDHWDETTSIMASANTLSAYFTDMQKRLNAIKRWLYETQPVVFWLPMFANVQAFFAAILQNYARQTNTLVDK